MRYTWPKKKLCRREWVNLFGVEKYDLDKWKRAPLPKWRKTSEFGLQLRKKQMAKRMFGLSEKQFASYFKKAQKSHADWTTWEKMLRFLEQRLDNLVYRSGFARTRMQSRQFVSHAHFTVNWVKVDVPSISVKPGDVIEVRTRLKESPLYKALSWELEEYAKANKWNISATKWINIDAKNLKITVKDIPTKDDFDSIIDVQRIVEFYSK